MTLPKFVYKNVCMNLCIFSGEKIKEFYYLFKESITYYLRKVKNQWYTPISSFYRKSKSKDSEWHTQSHSHHDKSVPWSRSPRDTNTGGPTEVHSITKQHIKQIQFLILVLLICKSLRLFFQSQLNSALQISWVWSELLSGPRNLHFYRLPRRFFFFHTSTCGERVVWPC